MIYNKRGEQLLIFPSGVSQKVNCNFGQWKSDIGTRDSPHLLEWPENPYNQIMKNTINGFMIYELVVFFLPKVRRFT